MVNIEEIPESKVVAVRVKALLRMRDLIKKEIEDLKIELEYLESELELAYEMTDFPNRFRIVRVEE